jgi:hypothetical protein
MSHILCSLYLFFDMREKVWKGISLVYMFKCVGDFFCPYNINFFKNEKSSPTHLNLYRKMNKLLVIKISKL